MHSKDKPTAQNDALADAANASPADALRCDAFQPEHFPRQTTEEMVQGNSAGSLEDLEAMSDRKSVV